jgi:hypothetical protein
MRLGIVMLALAACSGPGAASASPAWPKAAVREVDGGQSLAPRAAARAVAALVEDDKEDKPTDKAAADKPAAAATSAGGSTADKSAATSSPATPPDEPITAEDIVIEIED